MLTLHATTSSAVAWHPKLLWWARPRPSLRDHWTPSRQAHRLIFQPGVHCLHACYDLLKIATDTFICTVVIDAL